MEKSLQKEFNTGLIKAYQNKAYEQFLNYSFCTREFQDMDDRRKVVEGTKAGKIAEADKIASSPEYHTVENREKIKILKDSAYDDEKEIEALQQSMHVLDQAIREFRTKGDRFMRMAEYALTFELSEKKIEPKI